MNWLQKMSSEKIMIIARGPSGSGKSYMVKELAKNLDTEIFTTDDFFMQNGQYQFNPQKIGEAHEWNRQRVEDAAYRSVPVIIVDNTNTQFFEMKPYVVIAQENGYKIVFKEPDWHKELKDSEGEWNVDFLNKMQQSSNRDKSVPSHVIERMVDRYQYNPSVEEILKSRNPFE